MLQHSRAAFAAVLWKELAGNLPGDRGTCKAERLPGKQDHAGFHGHRPDHRQLGHGVMNKVKMAAGGYNVAGRTSRHEDSLEKPNIFKGKTLHFPI